jgi:hypothetical protein
MEKGPSAVFTNCPEYKCAELVPEDIFLRLVDPAKKRLLQGYFRHLCHIGLIVDPK